jgi:hypothetical protein
VVEPLGVVRAQCCAGARWYRSGLTILDLGMALSSCAAGGILVSAAHASVLAEGDAITVVESDVYIDIACLI